MRGWLVLTKNGHPVFNDDTDEPFSVRLFRTEADAKQWITDHPKVKIATTIECKTAS